jgi:hypothetical protein
MKTIYAVMANGDRNEGRGSMFPVCIVEDKALAEQIVQSDEYGSMYGVMGCRGRKSDIQELKVFSSKEDFDRMFRDYLLERAKY